MGDSNPENMVCVLTCDLEIRLQFVQISHFQQLRTRPTNDDSHAIVNPHGPLIIVWQYCNNNAATWPRPNNSGGLPLWRERGKLFPTEDMEITCRLWWKVPKQESVEVWTHLWFFLEWYPLPSMISCGKLTPTTKFCVRCTYSLIHRYLVAIKHVVLRSIWDDPPWLSQVSGFIHESNGETQLW